MTFEVYQRVKYGRPLAEMSVRVAPSGHVLHLNTKAQEALGFPKWVLLLNDGKNIAFSPAEKDDRHSYTVIKGNVSCRAFIGKVGLTPGTRLALRLEDGMLRSDGRG